MQNCHARYSTMLAEIWLETPTADSQLPEEIQIKDGKPEQEYLEGPSTSLVDATASVETRQMHADFVSHPNGLDFHNKEPNQIHTFDAGERNSVALAKQGERSNSEHGNANGEDQPHSLLNKSKDLKPLVRDQGGTMVDSNLRTEVLRKNGGDKAYKKMGIKEEDGEFSPENTEDVVRDLSHTARYIFWTNSGCFFLLKSTSLKDINFLQEDDLSTLEADEALITEEERTEELLALEREGNLPLEELLKMYSSRRG